MDPTGSGEAALLLLCPKVRCSFPETRTEAPRRWTVHQGPSRKTVASDTFVNA